MPAVAQPCLTMPSQDSPFFIKLARPVPTVARPCASVFALYFKRNSSFFLIQSLQLPSSLKLLSKTSITKNLQTIITPSNLHQITKLLHPIISKHHPKHNPPKRKGNEVSSSNDGASRNQATPRNHEIKINTPEQRCRYKSLLSEPLHPCRYLDSHTMNLLEIRDNVVRLLNKLGWVEMLRF